MLIYIVIILIIFTSIIIFLIVYEDREFSEKKLKYDTENYEFFTRKKLNNLEVKNTNSINLYFSIPETCIYWSLGIFRDNTCLKSVNMSEYLNYEIGDIIHILIIKNKNMIEPSSKKIKEEHDKLYSHKRLIEKIIFVDEDIINIKYESYFLKNVVNNKLLCYEFNVTNLLYERYEEVKKQKRNICKENYDLFKNVITNKKNIKVNKRNKRIFCECLSFVSDPFEITENFEIFAVNHFKTRTALYSHIIAIDYITGKIVKFFHTGIITDNIFDKHKIEIRHIKFENKNPIIVVENIFLYEDCMFVDNDLIIPMIIYN